MTHSSHPRLRALDEQELIPPSLNARSVVRAFASGRGFEVNEDEHINVVRRYFDACNSGAMDDFKPTLADDVVHYFLPDRFAPIRGADHLARFWRKFKQVSDTVWKIDEIIAQGDRVVGEWSLFWTPPGSKLRLKMRGSEWYEMRSGVIGEVRAYFAYDESRDTELTGFPYHDRRYFTE